MNLVDHQDRVAHLANLVEKAENARLKLSAELRSRNESGHIQKIDLLAAELVGNVSLNDAHGKRLGNGGLTHTGLTDQTGVVFLAAAKDLDHAHQLALASDDAVQASVSCVLRQISAVKRKELELFGILFLLFICLSLTARGIGMRRDGALLLAHQSRIAEELGQINGRCTAIGGIVRIRRRGDGLLHHGGQLLLSVLELVRRNAKLIHHVSNDVIHRNAQLSCAFQAKPLGCLLAVFHFGYEDNCHSFLALRT